MMRIAVIFREAEPTEAEHHWLWRSAAVARQPDNSFRDESEFGVNEEIERIAHALAAAGHEPVPFSTDSAAELCRFLDSEKPDIIFNCCEGFNGSSARELNVAAVFELFGIPFTGSPALTLGLAQNKAIAKAILEAAAIPTPPYAVVRGPADITRASEMSFPLIVKPLQEDASIGIDAHSVVSDPAALAVRVQFVLQEFRQPALAEEFIEGREFNIAVLAAPAGQFEILPVSEILFRELLVGVPRIVGYEAKWVKDSPYFHGTKPCCPAEIEAGLADRIRELTRKAVHALGVRDYARVDIRQRRTDGCLFVIEVNPNPNLDHDAGFMTAARASGRTYDETICDIVQPAIGRLNGRVA